MTETTASVTPDSTNSTSSQNELELFRLTDQVHQRLGALLERERVLEQFVTLLYELVPCQRVVVLMLDRDGVVLEFGACHPALADVSRQTQLEMLMINIFNSVGETVLQQIKQRRAAGVEADLRDRHVRAGQRRRGHGYESGR